MPKTPVTASMAASRPITPSTTAAVRAGFIERSTPSAQALTGKRNAGFKAGEGMTQRHGDLVRRQSRTDQHRRTCGHHFPNALRQRYEHRRPRVFIDGPVFAVFHDSHHLVLCGSP